MIGRVAGQAKRIKTVDANKKQQACSEQQAVSKLSLQERLELTAFEPTKRTAEAKPIQIGQSNQTISVTDYINKTIAASCLPEESGELLQL